MPNPPRSNKNSDALKQLDSALSQIKLASATLDTVYANWVVPDAPDQPPYIETLNGIRDAAAHAADVAGRLLATMGK